MKSARSRAYAIAATFIRNGCAQVGGCDAPVQAELDVIATALERAAAAMDASTNKQTNTPEAAPE